MSDRKTTKELLERLRRHYIKPGPMPGGVFLPECGWNGATGSRVDGLYVGFTSTSGRILIGHELKVSRADWRHELDQAGKADPWHDQCHAWYVVAPSTDIVPVEEIPEGWGLMVINPRTKTRLDIKVKAKVRADHTPSWNATRSIMARLDTLQRQELLDIRRTAEGKAREDLTKEFEKRRTSTMSHEDQRRLDTLADLERTLGVTVDRFDFRSGAVSPETLIKAIDLVQRHRDATTVDRFMPTQMRRVTTELGAALDAYEAAASDFHKALSDDAPAALL